MRKLLISLLLALAAFPAIAGVTTYPAPCGTFGTAAGTCAQGNDSRITGAAQLGTAETFTAAQRSAVSTLTISTATFTPSFDAAQNFKLTLINASCPCTIANPSTTPVAGQSGVFEIIQSGTGSDTIGTWGSNYTFAGGTSTIVLSTAAGARDYFSYYVADSTHIVLSAGALNASH